MKMLLWLWSCEGGKGEMGGYLRNKWILFHEFCVYRKESMVVIYLSCLYLSIYLFPHSPHFSFSTIIIPPPLPPPLLLPQNPNIPNPPPLHHPLHPLPPLLSQYPPSPPPLPPPPNTSLLAQQAPTEEESGRDLGGGREEGKEARKMVVRRVEGVVGVGVW